MNIKLCSSADRTNSSRSRPSPFRLKSFSLSLGIILRQRNWIFSTCCRFHTIMRTQRRMSNPKPAHITGGSGWGVRRGGGAGSSRIGCQQNCWPRTQAFLVPSKASKTRRLNVSPEARTSEILCKSTEEQNPRPTRGLFAVYHRDKNRSLFLAADERADAFLVSAKPFSEMGFMHLIILCTIACVLFVESKNQNITRARQNSSTRGRAAGRGRTKKQRTKLVQDHYLFTFDL